MERRLLTVNTKFSKPMLGLSEKKKKRKKSQEEKKKKARKKKIIFFNKFLFRFLYYYTNAKYNKPFVTYIQIKKIYITKKN